MRRLLILAALLAMAPTALAQSAPAPKLDTAALDAALDAALGRSGSWLDNIYLVDYFRPNLPVKQSGVTLAPGQVDSFATFAGTDDDAEMMGEVCALDTEVTPVVAALRAGGVEITGIHNHFLGESPRLLFVHFMGRGKATDLARAFRAGVAATSTPLGKVPPPAQSSPAPAWAKAVERELGRPGPYSADYGFLIVAFLHADFPEDAAHEFWFANDLQFQEAPGGQVMATGDLAVTAEELNPAISLLLENEFEILGVHNHMIDEEPRLFFVHFWKVGDPAALAKGLKASLAAIHTQ